MKTIAIILGFIPLLLPPLFGVGVSGTIEQSLYFERYISLVFLFGLWATLITLSQQYLRGITFAQITVRKLNDPGKRTVPFSLGSTNLERVVSIIILLGMILLGMLLIGFLRKLSLSLEPNLFYLVLTTMALAAFVRFLLERLNIVTAWIGLIVNIAMQTYLGFFVFIDRFAWPPGLLSVGIGLILAPTILSFALYTMTVRDSSCFPASGDGVMVSRILGLSVLVGLLAIGFLPVLHQLPKRYILLVLPTYLVPKITKEISLIRRETSAEEKILRLRHCTVYAMAVPTLVALLIALLGLF